MLVSVQTKGICVTQIKLAVSDGIIMGIEFEGGCDGQCKVLNALLSGQPVTYALTKLKGITCGRRNTSCANELANLLEDCVK